MEGDSGAPLQKKEIAELEKALPVIWDDLAPEAQEIIKKQGVAYIDEEGDIVTSIVNGKDCVFTCYDADGTCKCAVEKAYREWYRILKPGGVLINFDADYSAALEDEQQGGKKHELPENHAHKLVPDDLMAENNAITMEIGAYHGPRPQWDVQLLIEAGFERVTVDKGVYKRIYAEIDEFVNPTPIFTIAAFK